MRKARAYGKPNQQSIFSAIVESAPASPKP
jgi:hypothetical protein